MSTLLKYVIGIFVGLSTIVAMSGESVTPQAATPVVQETVSTPTKPAPTPSTYKEPVKSPYQAPTPTETVRTYTNTYGNTVQSPTHYDSRPSGASAQCRDGSYSFSQSRRGTCSHHGGVAEWY